MKQNHLGFFTKGTRMTIRMTEPLREALAEAAIEERDSMAEVAALAIFDSLWRRQVKKYAGSA